LPGAGVYFALQGKGVIIMTTREAKKVVAEMKAYAKKLTPIQAKEFLVKAGISTPDGKLTKPYCQDV
jgi:hypothetical protein